MGAAVEKLSREGTFRDEITPSLLRHAFRDYKNGMQSSHPIDLIEDFFFTGNGLEFVYCPLIGVCQAGS